MDCSSDIFKERAVIKLFSFIVSFCFTVSMIPAGDPTYISKCLLYNDIKKLTDK
jgi:hypothetical protein